MMLLAMIEMMLSKRPFKFKKRTRASTESIFDDLRKVANLI
jgi:hypothetical protein